MFEIAAFDWDDGNSEKCLKHGVSRAEIEAVFRGAPLVAPDHRHSSVETRSIAVGRGLTDRLIFVVFTLRPRAALVLIRPLSARYMHEKEWRHYVDQSSRL